MKIYGSAVWLLLSAAPPVLSLSPNVCVWHRNSSPTSTSRLDVAGADVEQSVPPEVPPASVPPTLTVPNRGKVNEIDFCIAPADVSLSRSYSTSVSDSNSNSNSSPKTLSLTRALNNASNRAVRRILLARSWPSAEALNLSLRQVLAETKQQKQQSPDIPLEDEDSSESSVLQEASETSAAASAITTTSTAKCPVPRPILNILMRRRNDAQYEVASSAVELSKGGKVPTPRSRTDDEYVADQLRAFRERYEGVPGYPLAEAYLECVLSLATSGIESPRVNEVMEKGIYDDSYRRVLNVLQSVGAVLEPVPGSEGRRRIAQKLLDQDICLSTMDKIKMKQEAKTNKIESQHAKVDVGKNETENETDSPEEAKMTKDEEHAASEAKPVPVFRLKFWGRSENDKKDNAGKQLGTEAEAEEEYELRPSDLGGVLLSAEEPSMTRQLNVLSNIVSRALLFGGDQELLVLSETLDADTPAFINRWYPQKDGEVIMMDPEDETRPGVQYLTALVQLLKICYRDGVVTTLDAPVPLIDSYKNAYDRLMASLVELGSGYVKLVANPKAMPVPRTAQEELGRFAVWESTFRQNTPDVSSYPEDLEGTWEVSDYISGEAIGVSTVVFSPQGEVEVAPPMQGLRWRLDPGPTHLDTCTFQVLSDDGTILQYRGFIDRGARLEARFSKRPIRIRGSVMFQMRDGETAAMGEDYWKDMLPINYKTGTTKFVMTKKPYKKIM